MWGFIIYCIIAILGLVIINRYAEDHPELSDEQFDEDIISDKEMLQIGCIVWPLFIIVIAIKYFGLSIYKILYYVVDKIYTKIISYTRTKSEENSKDD